MALLQPTNIIPSSFTEGVVDAENDTAQVSWQVNGNSAMTAYQIDFFQNNTNSTFVTSTGKVPVTGGFYGTDRFGKPQMYTWTAGGDNPQTWSAFHYAFTNGQQYKFKITQYWQEGGEEKSREQIEANVFITRSTPQVLIYLSDNTFQAKDENPALEDGSTLSTSIGYFRAEYLQEQGDAVRNARWQIATATFSNNQWRIVDIISDTGEVNTPTLQFEFNGFFNEHSYAVRCLIESESGQQANNPASQNDGWIFFTINIEAQSEYSGKFTLQCLPKENAAMLEWTNDAIPPVTSLKYALVDGAVELSSYATMKWSEATAFKAPWTVALGLNLQTTEQFFMYNLNGGSTYSNTFELKGKVLDKSDVTVVAGFTETFDVQISEEGTSCTVTIKNARRNSRPKVTIHETPFMPIGTLTSIDMEGGTITVAADYSPESIWRVYALEINGARIVLNRKDLDKISIILTDKKVVVYSNGKKFEEQEVSYRQNNLKSIEINGGVVGSTFRCVSVYKGILTDELIETLYSNADYKPSWDSNLYKLYLAANFIENINGRETFSYRVYRQEVGKESLYPIFYCQSGNTYQLKDYGIVSRKSYTYWLYEYDRNNAYLKGAQCKFPQSGKTATISTCFKSYSLLVCDYDSVNDAYHVRKQYLFALNLSAGSEGNNNTPTLNENFTQYPTRMLSTQNYASGTLQGLIGAIYTVPALVAEIDGRRQTVKPSTMDYFDSVDLEKELKDLSVTPYTLFLRDMSGNLRMITTSNQIGITPNLKKRQLPKTISFPWAEIGDASDVTIIQTPNDEGWSNEEQARAIRLGVDPQTGIQTANYPNPFEGTKFYLTGVKDETTKRG